MRNDEEVEKAIVAEGKTGERVTPQMIKDLIVGKDFHQFPGTQLIVCAITLKNGFQVTGESACAIPENFSSAIGQQLAYEKAFEKIWGLEGYLLKQKIYKQEDTFGRLPAEVLRYLDDKKVYESHKTVTAVPMSRGAYNVYRGWELPSDENGLDEGYLVEYLDGGESNHVNHKGYISWSPKKQFDDGYIENKANRNK